LDGGGQDVYLPTSLRGFFLASSGQHGNAEQPSSSEMAEKASSWRSSSPILPRLVRWRVAIFPNPKKVDFN